MHSVRRLRWDLADCSNNGVTSKHSNFELMTEEEIIEKLDILGMTKEEREKILVFKTTYRTGTEYKYCVPLESLIDNKWYMMGGNYINSCDSRYSEQISQYPIPVHDRVENF